MKMCTAVEVWQDARLLVVNCTYMILNFLRSYTCGHIRFVLRCQRYTACNFRADNTLILARICTMWPPRIRKTGVEDTFDHFYQYRRTIIMFKIHSSYPKWQFSLTKPHKSEPSQTCVCIVMAWQLHALDYYHCLKTDCCMCYRLKLINRWCTDMCVIVSKDGGRLELFIRIYIMC